MWNITKLFLNTNSPTQDNSNLLKQVGDIIIDYPIQALTLVLIGFFLRRVLSILFFFRKKKTTQLIIKNKNSSTSVSLNALRELILHFFRLDDDIIIRNISIIKKKNYRLLLEIKLSSNCNINEKTQEMESIILHELNQRLGTDTLRKVIIQIKDIFKVNRTINKLTPQITTLSNSEKEIDNNNENEEKLHENKDEEKNGWT